MSAIPLLLLFLLSALGSSCAAEEPPPRPNVVVLLSDDQAAGTMGYEGHPWSATPAVDRLAREGVVFDAAFVTTPLCSPSRATLLTGHHARSHGVRTNKDTLRRDLPTLASVLTQSGYDTAYVGKWHMGTDERVRPGFAYSATFDGQGTYRRNTYVVGTPEEAREVERLGWVDDVTTEFALEFLRRPRAAPFLLVVGFKSPHRPHLPPPRRAGQYAERTTELPPNADAVPTFLLDDPSEAVPDGGDADGYGDDEDPAFRAAAWRGGIQGSFQQRVRSYFEAIAGVDDDVALVCAALDELGLARDTVVVFTSDNGFCIGNHGLVGKSVLYEEAVRVPLVVRYPRRFGRRDVARPVANVDLAPTLLELAGADVAAFGAQGRSLVPLLLGAEDDEPPGIVLEYFRGDAREDAHGRTCFALRTPEWKLIEYVDDERWTELFHLAEDPYERHNLAADPDYAERLESLRGELARREAQLGPR